MEMIRLAHLSHCYLEVCRFVPPKTCSETKPPEMVPSLGIQGFQGFAGLEVPSRDLNIGVSPGFGGFDSGLKLQACSFH